MVTAQDEARVSVLLPARDAAASLATCLRSLVRQSETRWECILVDDASSDDTRAIAERFARADARFRIISGPGHGIVPALQLGLEHCRAPCVARMDADDWMHRERLAAQLHALEQAPELAGVGCHVRLFPRGSLTPGRRAYESWLHSIRSERDVRRDAFVECPLAHPTWLLRRELLDRLGYRDCGFPEDYDLLLRILATGSELGVVPRRLLGWRDGPSRLSRRHPASSDAAFTACKAEHLAARFLAETREYVLWGYGSTGRSLRRALARHDRTPSLIIELHPGRLGQQIHGAPVVSPDALPTLHGRKLIASVAGAGPRRQIRDALAHAGFEELRDFVCAA
jgi:glycosyltransferase involved in cell wall biosynthesis